VATETQEPESRRGDGLLVAALLVLLVAAWFEPAGSWLGEPDEARYAEIPREMLADGDFVTPRLNGVPYFEKPPLLYWSNAAAFALFGQTPWAARFPTRLFGTGTALLLAFAVGRLRGRREGLVSAIFLLAAPLGFTAARTNLTDGPLTFFFTATLLAGLATLRRAQTNRPAAALAAATGALAAAGFLSKGLVAVVLPGGILLFWALASGRGRHLKALLISPAAPAFLLVATPWPILAERSNPGFLQFFFIHEHFQRFATPTASRPGPIYYFAGIFLLGFVAGLPFFFRGAREAFARDPISLYFLIWFGVVLAFFSVSRSKLPPYIFPALPAAAALAARGLAAVRGPILWRIHAALAAVFVASCVAIPDVRATVRAQALLPLALSGAASILVGATLALAASRRPARAVAAAGFGWAGLYLALALAWPRTPLATDVHELAGAAQAAASASSARVVGYRCYLQGFPWRLSAVMPVADYRGELEDWWLPEERRQEIFWSRDRFWKEWGSGRPLVALVRVRDRGDFEGAQPPARFLECRRKHCVVSNHDAGPTGYTPEPSAR
jgi:4-amino-4-deoxy-L-arabinose transferase-like glycosyltransferase